MGQTRLHGGACVGLEKERVRIVAESTDMVSVLYRGRVTEMPKEHWTSIKSDFQVEDPARAGDLTWIPEVGFAVEGSIIAHKAPVTAGDLYNRKKENEPDVREK